MQNWLQNMDTSTKALRNMLAAMVISGSDHGKFQAISTDSFQAALPPQFQGAKNHEDAEEFLSYLLNKVSECFESNPSQSLLQENAHHDIPRIYNPAECLRGKMKQTCICRNANMNLW